VCAYVGVAKIPACSSFSWSTFQLDRATAASLCRGSTSPTRASWIPKRKRPQNSIGNSLWYGYSCSTRLKLRNSQIIIDCYLPKMMPILPNSLQDCTFGANMPKKKLWLPTALYVVGSKLSVMQVIFRSAQARKLLFEAKQMNEEPRDRTRE